MLLLPSLFGRVGRCGCIVSGHRVESVPALHEVVPLRISKFAVCRCWLNSPWNSIWWPNKRSHPSFGAVILGEDAVPMGEEDSALDGCGSVPGVKWLKSWRNFIGRTKYIYLSFMHTWLYGCVFSAPFHLTLVNYRFTWIETGLGCIIDYTPFTQLYHVTILYSDFRQKDPSGFYWL